MLEEGTETEIPNKSIDEDSVKAKLETIKTWVMRAIKADP